MTRFAIRTLENEELLPQCAFLKRVLKYLGLSLALVSRSLVVGILGYNILDEGLSPVDCFLNSAKIMSGMGPVNVLHREYAKLFVGVYAPLVRV